MSLPTISETESCTGMLLELSYADFQRNSNGSWVTTRQINISGPNGEQMLIAEGRRFTKGQMFILGLDLAAVLEQQCA
ncbi:MAG: hypothetical protein ACE5Q6_03960 [Dehalococcoidia bacterium]